MRRPNGAGSLRRSDLVRNNCSARPRSRYIVESTLLALCEDLCELSDEMKYVVRGGGPATAKLLDAMAAYRDSNVEDR